MKKISILLTTLLTIITFNVSAEGSVATPINGEVIEQDRGGVAGLEFPPTVETATVIKNADLDFVVKGRLGSGGIDYITFTMTDEFSITLDQFIF